MPTDNISQSASDTMRSHTHTTGSSRSYMGSFRINARWQQQQAMTSVTSVRSRHSHF